MRCQNCGYDNKSNAVRCEKCNAPMRGSMIREAPVPGNHNEEDIVISATRYGRQPEADEYLDEPKKVTPRQRRNMNISDANQKCHECGYPHMPGTLICPECGADLSLQASKPKRQATQGTITPWHKPVATYASLKLIPIDGETGLGSVPLTSDTNQLNRENLEKGNMTITSQVQAIIKQEDGKWFLEDKSSKGTTFIRASSAIEIKDGDIILMGNRLFEFKATS